MAEEIQKQEKIKDTESVINNEQKIEETQNIETPLVQKELTDSEKMDEILKEMKALKTEVFINRVIFAVALIIAMVYAHFQASHLKEILGTLLEMFLSG